MPRDIPSLTPILLSEEEHFPARVTVLSRIEYLKVINANLSKEDLEAFKASYFGHLLGLVGLAQISGQLIHHLLMRQVETKNIKEIWFNVYEKPLRFSMHEFALMTALNCDNTSSNPEFSELKLKRRLKNEYFCQKKKKPIIILEE